MARDIMRTKNRKSSKRIIQHILAFYWKYSDATPFVRVKINK